MFFVESKISRISPSNETVKSLQPTSIRHNATWLTALGTSWGQRRAEFASLAIGFILSSTNQPKKCVHTQRPLVSDNTKQAYCLVPWDCWVCETKNSQMVFYSKSRRVSFPSITALQEPFCSSPSYSVVAWSSPLLCMSECQRTKRRC